MIFNVSNSLRLVIQLETNGRKRASSFTLVRRFFLLAAFHFEFKRKWPPSRSCLTGNTETKLWFPFDKWRDISNVTWKFLMYPKNRDLERKVRNCSRIYRNRYPVLYVTVNVIHFWLDVSSNICHQKQVDQCWSSYRRKLCDILYPSTPYNPLHLTYEFFSDTTSHFPPS